MAARTAALDEGGASSSRSGAARTAGEGSTRASASAQHTSAGSAAASLATRRAHSFLGADDRIVLDIGTRVLKAGYSGEARPRIVVSSIAQSTSAKERGRASVSSAASRLHDDETLWTADILRCKDDAHRQKALYQLKGRLTRLLRKTMYESLSTDAKQRKVIILENVYMPEVVKDTIRDVLFRNLQVAAVAFVPAQIMTAVAIGRSCVLSLEIGYEQATLVPVYFWRPMTPRFLATTSRAGRRVRDRLRALLLHFGTFTPARSASTAAPEKGKVKAEHLDLDFLEDIMAKCLVVAGPPTSKGRRQAQRPGLEGKAWQEAKVFSKIPEEQDEVFMLGLQKQWASEETRAKDMTIAVPAPPHPPVLPATQPSTLGHQGPTLVKSPGTITVPGWIRERTTEVLFESGDDDEPSLLEIVLDVLQKLPIDIRTVMAASIYVSGGIAMLPGLAHRLRVELASMLQQAAIDQMIVGTHSLALTLPRVGSRRRQGGPEVRITTPGPASVEERQQTADDSFVSAKAENTIGDDSFLSAASQGSTIDAPRNVTVPTSYTAEHNDRYTPIAQLSSHIAVINDHAPRLDVEGSAIGGHAPAFAASLASWIGASLLGSLRIESLDATTREVWEAAHVQPERERERSDQQRSPSKALASHDQASKGAAQVDGATSQRPGHRPSLASGRGSFLGSVGGLDLGSYGPLSDGAHGTFSGNPEIRSPTRRP